MRFGNIASRLNVVLWVGPKITRKRWFVGAGLVALVSLVIAVLVTLESRETAMKARFAQIELGLSPHEVQAIFGRPADRHELETPGRARLVRTSDIWIVDNGIFIIVHYDDDIVKGADWVDRNKGRLPNTMFGKLHRWLFPHSQ
jgi:hypothetical protein